MAGFVKNEMDPNTEKEASGNIATIFRTHLIDINRFEKNHIAGKYFEKKKTITKSCLWLQ